MSKSPRRSHRPFLIGTAASQSLSGAGQGGGPEKGARRRDVASGLGFRESSGKRGGARCLPSRLPRGRCGIADPLRMRGSRRRSTSRPSRSGTSRRIFAKRDAYRAQVQARSPPLAHSAESLAAPTGSPCSLDLADVGVGDREEGRRLEASLLAHLALVGAGRRERGERDQPREQERRCGFGPHSHSVHRAQPSPSTQARATPLARSPGRRARDVPNGAACVRQPTAQAPRRGAQPRAEVAGIGRRSGLTIRRPKKGREGSKSLLPVLNVPVAECRVGTSRGC